MFRQMKQHIKFIKDIHSLEKRTWLRNEHFWHLPINTGDFLNYHELLSSHQPKTEQKQTRGPFTPFERQAFRSNITLEPARSINISTLSGGKLRAAVSRPTGCGMQTLP